MKGLKQILIYRKGLCLNIVRWFQITISLPEPHIINKKILAELILTRMKILSKNVSNNQMKHSGNNTMIYLKLKGEPKLSFSMGLGL